MASSVISLPDPATDKPSRRQRWIPRSLQMFVAIVAVPCLTGLIWIGARIHRQQPAMFEIERVGGTYGTQLDQYYGTKLDFVARLGRWINPDGVISEVTVLHLSGPKVTDDTLSRLKPLTSLPRLSLRNTQVTDGGLVHLSGLANLKQLSLRTTPVTDKGLDALQKALPDCKISR